MERIRSADMKKIMMYTDGACKGNPGPGGFGAILVYGEIEKVLAGGALETTNNRMELSAVIAGFEALKQPCHVTLTSDSTYVLHSLTKGWVDNWKSKHFMKGTKPVPNTDLWKRLLAAMEGHTVEYVWVKGHNGHPYNERCDALAVEAAQTAMDTNADVPTHVVNAN